MKTPNFDKHAYKCLLTPVKKLENISVIDITGHDDVPYQLLRMNRMPFYSDNKSQTNCTRNRVKYSTIQQCPMLQYSLLFPSVCVNYFMLEYSFQLKQ